MIDKIKEIIGNKSPLPLGEGQGEGSGRGLGGGLTQKTSTKVSQVLSNLSDRELEKLVEEKLDYLKWLIKYSRACDLELVPSPAGLDTFACGPGEESEKIISQYMKGEILFHEIPEGILKPKKFYYDLKMLLEYDMKSLGALGDHEIQHAEDSDYGDIIWTNKRAQDLGLPVSVISLFFNGANEDPFIGRKVSKKGPNKKNMVAHLYQNMLSGNEDKDFDISKAPSLKQLEIKMAYFWLNRDFPDLFEVDNIKVSEQIETIFNEEILPNFDQMISPDIPNLSRVIFKNSILLPIVEDLARKDLERAMQQKKFQEMLQDIMKKQGDGQPQDGKGQPQEGKPESQEGQNSENVGNDGNRSEPQEGKSDSNSPLPLGEGQGVRDKEPTEEDLKKVQEAIDKMSEEDRKKFEKEVKSEIDKENLDKLNKEIPGLDWKQNEDGDLEFKPKTLDDKAKKEAKKLEEKLEKAIEKHEEEIAKTQDLKKKVAEAKTQEEVEQINEEAKGIKSDKLKKSLQSQIQGKKEQIEGERIRKVQDMIEQGFNEGEEKYFEEFIKLEEEIEPYVDDFIKALTDYIPKLRDYIYVGNYHTGTLYDIPTAGRKIKMGHYSIYGRKDEVESMQINLGISLSLDVSVSMKQNGKIQESLKLMVFLGIFCEKLGIPFYINTIGLTTREIKGVNDEYINSKGNIMKSTLHLEDETNMTETFENVQEMIVDQKYKMPSTEFIPIIITDGVPTDGNIKLMDGSNKLIEVIDKFDGLDIIFGLNLGKDEKQKTKKYFKKGKKIFLDDATQILDIGKTKLIDYLVDNKYRIFTLEQE
ncbi:hypothetical protein M0P65_04265 [Candidatus Gracilibacteria bacterium]|nr:hypothetical protein [Candidatus Gracilibacteria bacterium]